MRDNEVYLILGSNINREHNLPAAARLLDEMTNLVAVSSVYETAPVGLTTQPSFFNAAALIQTPLTPSAIKQTLIQVIEEKLHRVRLADKNAPRTIDIDIVLFNLEILEYEGRHLPDPDLLRFAHVAVPLAELAPHLHHPETGETIREIAARLVAAADEPLFPRPDIPLSLLSS